MNNLESHIKLKLKKNRDECKFMILTQHFAKNNKKRKLAECTELKALAYPKSEVKCI